MSILIYNNVTNVLTMEKVEKKRVFWGDYAGHFGGKELSDLKELESIKDIEEFFRQSVGEFALVYLTPMGLAVTTTSFKNVYYTVQGDMIYFSDKLKELEELFCDFHFINFDMVFYYVSSGYYPPMDFTFFKNISKVCGDHTCIFKGIEVWENKNYNAIQEEQNNRKMTYKTILDFEVKSWKEKYLKGHPYITISGADSFNVFLAYGEGAYAIHNNVNDTQEKYVSQFITLMKKQKDYIEINADKNPSITPSEILKLYGNFIMPFLKYRTVDVLYDSIKQRKGEVVFTGDLTGLSMAFKSFTSTIEQHSFFGRHLLGALKRLNYTDWKIMNLNRKTLNQQDGIVDLYYFMASSFVPTYHFNSIKPMKSIKKIDGLTDLEKEYYLHIMDICISKFETSIDWNRYTASEKAPFVYRVFKKQLYSASFGWENQQYKERYGLTCINIFSSTIATRFLYNYKALLEDVFQCKKVVYDYFEEKTGITIKKLGKLARKMCRTSTKIRDVILLLNEYIPPVFKETRLFLQVKKKLFKSIVNRGGLGRVNLIDLKKDLDLILFSEASHNDILKAYFNKLEIAINKKDLSFMTGEEERYLNILIYINQQIKQKEIGTKK